MKYIKNNLELNTEGVVNFLSEKVKESHSNIWDKLKSTSLLKLKAFDIEFDADEFVIFLDVDSNTQIDLVFKANIDYSEYHGYTIIEVTGVVLSKATLVSSDKEVDLSFEDVESLNDIVSIIVADGSFYGLVDKDEYMTDNREAIEDFINQQSWA